MIEVTSFLIKHLYEMMADYDQNDLDSLMVLMAQNQIPNLICDTIVELLFIFVSAALIIVLIALSEFYSEEVSCSFLADFGCPQKIIQATYWHISGTVNKECNNHFRLTRENFTLVEKYLNSISTTRLSLKEFLISTAKDYLEWQ